MKFGERVAITTKNYSSMIFQYFKGKKKRGSIPKGSSIEDALEILRKSGLWIDGSENIGSFMAGFNGSVSQAIVIMAIGGRKYGITFYHKHTLMSLVKFNKVLWSMGFSKETSEIIISNTHVLTFKVKKKIILANNKKNRL